MFNALLYYVSTPGKETAMARVIRAEFIKLVVPKLGDQGDRALNVFDKYSDLSFDVTEILLESVNQGKVSQVLVVLEAASEKTNIEKFDTIAAIYESLN